LHIEKTSDAHCACGELLQFRVGNEKLFKDGNVGFAFLQGAEAASQKAGLNATNQIFARLIYDLKKAKRSFTLGRKRDLPYRVDVVFYREYFAPVECRAVEPFIIHARHPLPHMEVSHRHDHGLTLMPPSNAMHVPLMKSADGLARNSTRSATSCVSTKR
jgi:hypothetical protein